MGKRGNREDDEELALAADVEQAAVEGDDPDQIPGDRIARAGDAIDRHLGGSPAGARSALERVDHTLGCSQAQPPRRVATQLPHGQRGELICPLCIVDRDHQRLARDDANR